MKRTLRNLHRYTKERLLRVRVPDLRGHGIVNLIDVGSAGDLPSPWKENANKILHLLKFEPRDKRRRSRYVDTVDVALWEANCERELYVYRGFGGSGASLFPQNYEYVTERFEELRRYGPPDLANTWFERSQLNVVKRVPCRRLDDVLARLGHSFDYHFLKIDTQGAEYQVLRGARRFLLNSCLGLHVELFALPLYEGIKLLPEVLEYLDAFGFELVKKFPAHGSFDSQHDCLFLRKGEKSKVVDAIRQVYGL